MLGKLTFEDFRRQPLRGCVGGKPPHGIEQRVVSGLRSQKTADDAANRLSLPRVSESLRGFHFHRYGNVNGLGHSDLLVDATLLRGSAG
jgi:hypothetical protein